jgi:hypothetical protein
VLLVGPPDGRRPSPPRSQRTLVPPYLCPVAASTVYSKGSTKKRKFSWNTFDEPLDLAFGKMKCNEGEVRTPQETEDPLSGSSRVTDEPLVTWDFVAQNTKGTKTSN